MGKNNEIIDAKVAESEETERSVALLADDSLVSIAEQVEKRVNAIQKIKLYALKLTNVHDWIDQGGRPYLYGSGAEKIARMFGISWRINEPERENLGEGHYMFTYKGVFSLAGAEVEAIGTRSSKDPFFKKYTWVNGERVELPASEIDPGDVKKAALTNCIANGVGRLLGIRNLTYEDLEQATGITKDMITRFEYKKDGKRQEHIASDEAVTVTINVTDVRKKEGTSKSGKNFTKYIIKGEDGNNYTTFSETFAKIAKEGKEGAIPVVITYKPSKFGNDIETLKLKEEHLQERLPGEEG